MQTATKPAAVDASRNECLPFHPRIKLKTFAMATQASAFQVKSVLRSEPEKALMSLLAPFLQLCWRALNTVHLAAGMQKIS
ncbi:hypothetical protein SKAU_G00353510 [Synaphobranchus kaupii]|uniref:Uncharacterized protein n=1 Tax=Synaphobranchus kaupii TaxID=118154 RepID=A0A9Q1EKZ2_SYNKA|nr:hypothetical protein SKAU_G00353510 [Synaphobranchus kaupii]